MSCDQIKAPAPAPTSSTSGEPNPIHPFSAFLEISDRCNEVCIHCYQVQGEKGEMTTEEVYAMLDALAARGVIFLTISGGEATLRRDFLEILRYARAKGFAVKLFTNGLTMTDELAAELHALAVHEVEVSLYSHRAEVHDWVTRVPGSWERTVAAIRHLRRHGLKVLVKTPLMTFNAAEFRAYVAFVTDDLGAQFLLDTGALHAREDGDRALQALSALPEDVLRVMRDDEVRRHRPAPPIGEKSLDAAPCGACRGTIHVKANGELRPCAMLDINIGNIRTDGVRAWDDHPEARMLRSLTWGDLHGCRDCDLRKYCSRCFEQSRTTRGDAMGPYALACAAARMTYERTHGTPPKLVPSSERTSSPELGPYRAIAGDTFELAADRVTDADHAFASQHAWARGETAPDPAPATPGQLVQIRRPGKRAAIEQIPAVPSEVA